MIRQVFTCDRCRSTVVACEDLRRLTVTGDGVVCGFATRDLSIPLVTLVYKHLCASCVQALKGWLQNHA